MMPRVYTYFTPPYEPSVLKLMDDCKEHGLDIRAQPVESRGSWRLNCGIKPTYLYNCMRVFQQPMVWLDADARVRRSPDLFEQLVEDKVDFAAWFIPNKRMYPPDVPCGRDSGNDGIASGTMFWNFTDRGMDFLRAWKEAERGQGKYEQQVLGELWHTRHNEFRISTYRLPQAYTKVCDAPWFEDETGPVVIEHMQASRKLKRKA